MRSLLKCIIYVPIFDPLPKPSIAASPWPACNCCTSLLLWQLNLFFPNGHRLNFATNVSPFVCMLGKKYWKSGLKVCKQFITQFRLMLPTQKTGASRFGWFSIKINLLEDLCGFLEEICQTIEWFSFYVPFSWEYRNLWEI